MRNEILDVLNVGIVILDSQYMISEWNSWMEINSGIDRDMAVGTNLFNHFPELSSPTFTRGCKSVLKFGNYIYFSQKLHNYMFPFKTTGIYANHFEYMQQSCTLSPLHDKEGKPEKIVLAVQNVTESVYLERNLKLMTQQDSLTGIRNRRFLDQRLKEEFKRYTRSGRAFSLLMIDIDYFKKVNDNYGHQFGDQVLKAVARCCSDSVRGSDIVARFGGEEFSIVLVDSPVEGAASFAERLRKEVEKTVTTTETGKDVSVTVSVGIDCTSKETTGWEELISNADAALYTSKERGRNRVTVYEHTMSRDKPVRRAGD